MLLRKWTLTVNLVHFTGTNNVEEQSDVFDNEILWIELSIKSGKFYLIPVPSVGEVKDCLMSELAKIKLLLIWLIIKSI